MIKLRILLLGAPDGGEMRDGGDDLIASLVALGLRAGRGRQARIRRPVQGRALHGGIFEVCAKGLDGNLILSLSVIF